MGLRTKLLLLRRTLDPAPGHADIRNGHRHQLAACVQTTTSRIPGDSVSVYIHDAEDRPLQYIDIAIRRRNGSLLPYSYDQARNAFRGRVPDSGDSLCLFRLERLYRQPYVLPTDSGNRIDVLLEVAPLMPLYRGSRRQYLYPFKLTLQTDSLVQQEHFGYGDPSAYRLVR